MRLAIHRALKRLIIDAFASEATSPERVAQVLWRAPRRPCGKQEAERFRSWLEGRKIKRLVHFTPLRNVVPILRYGLLPREYLQIEVVRLALGPKFTDGQRLEGKPHFNCLSFTSPNYRMFFSKRRSLGGSWAVVEFNPRLLTRLYCDFAPTNAASGCSMVSGVVGAERLFDLPELRQQLGLTGAEPTDPQAEVLCDSVISPDDVSAVYVQEQTAAEWLRQRGVASTVNAELFMPRRDHAFWKGRTITSLPEYRMRRAG